MIKTNNTIKALTASLALLIPATLGTDSVEAIILTPQEVAVKEALKEKQILLEEEKRNSYIQMMQIIEQQKRQEELKREKEEAERREQALLLEQRKNFFYLVSTKNITQLDLTTASGLTIEQAESILSNTGLAGLGKAFVEAEQNYGVNAYYLMAHAAWESQWGKSQLAINKNNLFGFTAYDATPGESATKFSSKAQCIDVVARYVKNNYLNNDGQHYNGSNLKGMNVKYASDTAWAEGIGSIMKKFVGDAKKINQI